MLDAVGELGTRETDLLEPVIARRQFHAEHVEVLRAADHTRRMTQMVQIARDARHAGFNEGLSGVIAKAIHAAREIQIERARAASPCGADEAVAALEQEKGGRRDEESAAQPAFARQPAPRCRHAERDRGNEAGEKIVAVAAALRIAPAEHQDEAGRGQSSADKKSGWIETHFLSARRQPARGDGDNAKPKPDIADPGDDDVFETFRAEQQIDGKHRHVRPVFRIAPLQGADRKTQLETQGEP